jgi:hypothetical protein
LKDPAKAPAKPTPHPYQSEVARSVGASLDRLESKLRR